MKLFNFIKSLFSKKEIPTIEKDSFSGKYIQAVMKQSLSNAMNKNCKCYNCIERNEIEVPLGNVNPKNEGLQDYFDIKNRTESSNIVNIPLNICFREAESQRDRILLEVMEKLFEKIPDRGNNNSREADFVLKDGRKAWIVKYYKPSLKIIDKDNSEMRYGFDVQFSKGSITHLEFGVTCTGWERSFICEDQ